MKQESIEITIVQDAKGPDYYRQRLIMWKRVFEDTQLGKKPTIPPVEEI